LSDAVRADQVHNDQRMATRVGLPVRESHSERRRYHARAVIQPRASVQLQ
jgi:hypothetical protein